MQISLAIITLNEEENIARCIRSAKWVDDIVVLDSGSTDRTRDIAEDLGARVFNENWRGFGPQKARAVELCKHEIVLSLDADEALSPELSTYLQGVDRNFFDSYDGIRFPRRSFYLGRWIKRGGWAPDYQLRFFHRKQAQWTQSHVHEHIFAERVYTIKELLYHFPFKEIAAQVSTNNRYSGLGALDLQKAGKKFSVVRLCIKPVSKFIETYFLKLGVLDGLAGFVISAGAAYSVFLKWCKLWELEKSEEWQKRQEAVVSKFQNDT